MLGIQGCVLHLAAAGAEPRQRRRRVRMQLTPTALASSPSSVSSCSGLSSSLAPPPLDDDLASDQRLAQVKTCLGRPSAHHGDRVLVSYDIIRVYKGLVLSCGIGLEGSCEDPKVGGLMLMHRK